MVAAVAAPLWASLGPDMFTRRKTSSCDDRDESLKPSTRSLFQPIQCATKTTNMP
jgi:hypothetical protein